MKTVDSVNEYAYNEWEDDDRMWKIKAAIEDLRPVEKQIFMSYVEGGTYVSVAKEYKVSVPTARKYIIQVRNKILEMIDNGEE